VGFYAQDGDELIVALVMILSVCQSTQNRLEIQNAAGCVLGLRAVGTNNPKKIENTVMNYNGLID
jgi:hypothetical protein